MFVASKAEARRVEAIGKSAEIPLMLVITNATQSAPVVAGCTVAAAMRNAYLSGWALFIERDPSFTSGWSIWHGGEAKPLDHGALHFMLKFGDGLSQEERPDLCDLYEEFDTPPYFGSAATQLFKHVLWVHQSPPPTFLTWHPSLQFFHQKGRTLVWMRRSFRGDSQNAFGFIGIKAGM